MIMNTNAGKVEVEWCETLCGCVVFPAWLVRIRIAYLSNVFVQRSLKKLSGGQTGIDLSLGLQAPALADTILSLSTLHNIQSQNRWNRQIVKQHTWLFQEQWLLIWLYVTFVWLVIPIHRVSLRLTNQLKQPMLNHNFKFQ